MRFDFPVAVWVIIALLFVNFFALSLGGQHQRNRSAEALAS